MVPTPDFAAHRAALLNHLEDDEALLLFGSPVVNRNADSEHRYRPDSDIYWLTGWRDPEVAVFLRPGGEPFTLFCQDKDKDKEIWTGYRPGPEGAMADFGADRAFAIDQVGKQLPELLQGVRTLHYVFGDDHERDRMLRGAIAVAAKAGRPNGLDAPEVFKAPSVVLHELRLRKSEAELANMREAARLTDIAFRAAMATARPGGFEYEVEATIDHVYRRHGGTGAGFETITAAGDHACTLHYVRNDGPLHEGELLLVDAGAEFGFYSADVSRTFPIDGHFTEAQRQVYQWVLAAQLAAIDNARPGKTFMDMHHAAVRVLTEGMVALGLLQGDVDELIEGEAYKRYYVHGTGHWLGLDVHDVGSYGRGGQSRILEPGMVCTVEPGLYIPADDTDAPEALRGIGVRIEDDVLVTDGDPENLTESIPKTIEEVEEACAVAPPAA